MFYWSSKVAVVCANSHKQSLTVTSLQGQLHFEGQNYALNKAARRLPCHSEPGLLRACYVNGQAWQKEKS